MPGEWVSGFGSGDTPPSPTPAELRCSFCGKPQSRVRKLIAGHNRVAICNECVELCGEIIADESDADGPA